MHIPDGFLDLWVCVLFYLVMIAFLIYAYRKELRTLDTEKIIWVANLSAVIFVAQMLNWPLPGGTSLHFVGGALTGILLGPYLGFLVIFFVLLVQCLVFHDGGITTLGTNVFNMAIVDVFVGYYIFRLFRRANVLSEDKRMFLGAFFGGWFGITLAGLSAGLQLGVSKQFIYGLGVTLPVMGLWHFVLGIIEGVITGLAILGLRKRGHQIPLFG